MILLGIILHELSLIALTQTLSFALIKDTFSRNMQENLQVKTLPFRILENIMRFLEKYGGT